MTTAMLPKPTISFARRGLTGLLLIAAGLTMCFVFRRSSAWGLEVQQLLFPLALVLAVGGGNLLSSYMQQRSFKAMKTELLASAVIVGTLLLSSWTR